MILSRWRSTRLKRAVLDAWSRHHSRNGRSLELLGAALVRYSCLEGRDILAHAASDGLHDWSSLSRRLASARRGGESSGNAPDVRLRPGPARTLARVLYRQQVSDADLPDAVEIYETLRHGDEEVLEPVDHGYLVDALTVLGRRSEAFACLEQYESGLRELEACTYLFANLLNPHTGGSGGEAEWLDQVSAPLTAHGLEPLQLGSGDAAPFCRLACEAAQPVTDGPLVSVLMPVHESTNATDIAIRSILGQSWRNLELIIVDDGSTASSRERLRNWEGRDARLQIVYSDENRGAYGARNAAYRLARGEFVTVADKDDWHHPRRIELHARDLIGQPEKLANMSSWSRVDENLSFLVRYAPIKMAHPSQPSLFFRREPVKEALGYWDSVRKGADGEYKLRMERTFGIKIKPINRLPLALSLMGRENLSSSDFGLGYEHPDRSAYKQTYGHWHQRIPESANPYIPELTTRRRFPAPTAFLATTHTPAPFDVIFALDFGANTTDGELIRSEMVTGLDRGMRIAALHLPDMMRLSRKPRPTDWLNDLILDDKVSRLTLTDRADTRIFLLSTPRILQYRSRLSCRISPQRTLVLAGTAPLDPVAGAYFPRAIADNIRAMFTADAIWVPFDRDIRRALRPVLKRREIAPYDWSGITRL